MVKTFPLLLIFLITTNLYSQCITCTTSDPINNGLVWCHNFTGNTADQTGNGYDGSYNGANFVADRFGNLNSAVAFNGSSTCYIEINKLLPDMTSFSISFWVKQNTSSIAGGLFWEGNNVCGEDVYIDMGNKQITSSKQASALINANVDLAVSTSGWSHFVWTATSTQSKLYKNGALVNTINSSASWVGNHYKPTYGCWNDGNGGSCGFPKSYFFIGILDDVRLYNRVLSSAEVTQLYNLNSSALFVDAGLNKSVCSGDTAYINTLSTTGSSLLWSPNISIDNINSPTPKFYPSSNQTYIVKASLGSCSSYDTIDIIVNNITSNAGGDKFLCKGESITLDGQETLNATYLWSPNININNISIAKPLVNPTITQKYILKTTLNSCSKYDTVSVFISASFSNAGQDKIICSGDSIQLNGQFSGSSFAWIKSLGIIDTSIINPWVKPGTNSKYILVVKSDYGCLLYDTVSINISNAIQCDAGSDILKCPNDTIKLQGVSNTSSFFWYATNFIEDSTILTTRVWSRTPTQYVLNCQNGSCIITDTVIVQTKKEPTLGLDSLITICIDMDYLVKTTYADANWFLWSPTMGVSNSTISNPVIKVTKPTEYYLTIKDSIDNCPIKSKIIINISKPVASFNASPVSGKIPFNIATSNTSAGANKFIWSINNQKIDTSYTIYYIKPDSGKTNIGLIAIDSIGCSDTTYHDVIGYTDGNLFIPNVFTPDNDSINNLFEPSYNKSFFIKLNMKIYNRWGQQLFETELPDGTWWDGKYQDNFCQSEVYFYILNVTDIMGNQKDYHGTVTLLR